MTVIASKNNPKVQRWAKLARHSRLRRDEGRALIEGPHLVAELLAAGLKPVAMLVSETGLGNREIAALLKGFDPIVLSDSAFGSVVDAETPPGIAAEIEIPSGTKGGPGDTVFLEGIQDPSNVGAILRSAAAFGASRAVLDRGCADPWSPKTLRAGMGAHFRLAIQQVRSLEDHLAAFSGTLICTVPRDGVPLATAKFEHPLGWILGAEGQGISEAAGRHAKLKVTIPMAAGVESLNVAAAAAICLYETSRRAARS
jgi:TrmH family RNA methyltransferase